MSNDFLFASDEFPTPQDLSGGTGDTDRAAPPWLVLVADDEPEVHAVTRLALARLRFRGRPVRLLDCPSAAEAERILRDTPDIAVILLDVVMETEDAGLRLARRIREELGNRAIRIVLRTGQPARVPEEELVLAYEIDGYTAKTELTARRLFTSVVTALRAYADLAALEQKLAERGRALEEATVRLNRMATLDPLTGVWNRRRFLELAAAELARARRYGRHLGVFLLDLDGFKAVNDAHGDAVGDAVLRAVVKRIRAALRISDHIARSGGRSSSCFCRKPTMPAAPWWRNGCAPPWPTARSWWRSGRSPSPPASASPTGFPPSPASNRPCTAPNTPCMPPSRPAATGSSARLGNKVPHPAFRPVDCVISFQRRD